MNNRLLNELDLHSQTIEKIRTHYEERLATLRRSNDKPASAEDTAALRGQIKEVKYLLALVNPDPAKVADAAP